MDKLVWGAVPLAIGAWVGMRVARERAFRKGLTALDDDVIADTVAEWQSNPDTWAA